MHGGNYDKLYGRLDPPERLTLLVEAMARGDEAEADRLEDACPAHNYHLQDLEYRDRMRRAYTISLLVTLNMRQGLGQIRAAVAFSEVYRDFAHWPALAVRGAFLFGRAYARWEADGGECEPVPAGEALDAELGRCPDLKLQMMELRDVAELAMGQVSDTLTYAVGEMNAVDLLSQWEGFGRFCRESLSLEPLTLLRALRLGREDPAAEVLASYPDAKADEAKAAEWAGNWARQWGRRFGRD
jgi:hypothetical protein